MNDEGDMIFALMAVCFAVLAVCGAILLIVVLIDMGF